MDIEVREGRRKRRGARKKRMNYVKANVIAENRGEETMENKHHTHTHRHTHISIYIYIYISGGFKIKKNDGAFQV